MATTSTRRPEHYNYFRDYDPAIGRYIESDPIGLEGGFNTFAYVDDAPLSSIDARGQANNGWNPRLSSRQGCYESILRDSFREVEKQGGWSSVADNTPFNAVLHCYGVCQLEKKCGTLHRVIVAYGHEVWDVDKAKGEKIGMPAFARNPNGTLNDLSNNSQGVDCAKSLKCDDYKAGCMSCCLEKLTKGLLSSGGGDRRY